MNVQAAAPEVAPRLWEHFIQLPRLFVRTAPLLKPDTKVFTIGSCFAVEIRRALARKGYAVYPHYTSVAFDRAVQIFDKVPEREAIAHYDTFVIRQEFESALGVWTDRDADFWEVRDAMVNKALASDVVFQEPSRKLVYAKTRAHLKQLSDGITAAMREGIEQADLLVITLGLTEVWQHNTTGRYLCRPPGTGYGGGTGLATFRQSTFVENYENVKATLELLLSRFPQKQVIISVSPVPLAATYSKTDVGTANMESKSILRAVAGQICREFDSNVTYFPSYEMANMQHVMSYPVFQDDKRHVLPEFADRVVKNFQAAFSG